jgi:hypothetical protein
LVWVLKSLKNDKITPTEKNIHNRFKEAFGYRVNEKYWS